MDHRQNVFQVNTKQILMFTVLVTFLGMFFPPFVQHTSAQLEANSYAYLNQLPQESQSALGVTSGLSGGAASIKPTPGAGANDQCTAVPFKYGTPCFTWKFFGTSFASGICTGAGICTATAVTPFGAIGAGAVSGTISGFINIGLKAFSGGGTTGSTIPSYTSVNPYGQATCTGTRYISPVQTNDPCGLYIPTTPINTNPIDLTNPGGGSTTIDTNALISASLTVVPISGKAPLTVTFSVTDTSPSCGHPAIMLSAGDGTSAVVAIPATTACIKTPVTFTYTYGTAGTYSATLSNQATQQVIQTQIVTVTGSTNPGTGTVGSVSLSVTPTSGSAPLKVTFTVTDTTTTCPRSGVDLSAGDGSTSVEAIPASSRCGAVSSEQFTYTYTKTGTYNATIINKSTQQVIQTVVVTVGSGTLGDQTNATLNVLPTSGEAPLKVAFTVTDTTAVCPRSQIILSAGDGSNPVAALPGSTQCTRSDSVQFTYNYTTPGTYNATITNPNTAKVLHTAVVTVSPPSGTATPPQDTTNANLTVVPAFGTAPLNVQFTVTDTSTSCPRSAIMLYAGDGSQSVTALPATVTCTGIAPVSFNYTYRNVGKFQAEIANANTKQVLRSVLVTVSPGNPDTTVPPLTVTTPIDPRGTVNVSSSLLNLTNGTVNTAAAPPPVRRTVQSGTWGDIQILASGVTITAGGHDTDGRTGVAGFYGYNTVPGVTPQDLAKQMCAARPWANSSATSIIPPSFYDSICTTRGYKAGTAAPASNTGSASGTSSGSKTTAPSGTASTATKASDTKTSAATSTKATTPATPPVPARVFITAVPASIRIGGRTSVFWNAVGVKSCLLTSPDGSFNAKTIYGAASTVALTGETIFSIVCIKPDESQISNYVRVRLAI
jgi:PKD repeat protein